MCIGYARVSAPHQNLDWRIAALRVQQCHQISREEASGKGVKNRPGLEKAIDALGTGDVLVLAEWDRATSSMLDGVRIIEKEATDGHPRNRAGQNTGSGVGSSRQSPSG
jgi:DNA invertase Pin-like site-specific DNA recombinase